MDTLTGETTESLTSLTLVVRFYIRDIYVGRAQPAKTLLADAILFESPPGAKKRVFFLTGNIQNDYYTFIIGEVHKVSDVFHKVM